MSVSETAGGVTTKLMSERSTALLMDATPLPTGAETAGGVVTKLIGRNTIITTSSDQLVEDDGDTTFVMHKGTKMGAACATCTVPPLSLELSTWPAAVSLTRALEATIHQLWGHLFGSHTRGTGDVKEDRFTTWADTIDVVGRGLRLRRTSCLTKYWAVVEYVLLSALSQ